LELHCAGILQRAHIPGRVTVLIGGRNLGAQIKAGMGLLLHLGVAGWSGYLHLKRIN
jgi:hypothetical protein